MDGEIRTPAKVAGYAAGEISDLHFYLDEYKSLPEALTDQGAWERVSNSVRKKVSAVSIANK